jgi:hypothetical protein
LKKQKIPKQHKMIQSAHFRKGLVTSFFQPLNGQKAYLFFDSSGFLMGDSLG